MNGRTSKLLRRWSSATGQEYRPAKRLWNQIPRNQQGKLRKSMLKEIQEVSEEKTTKPPADQMVPANV